MCRKLRGPTAKCMHGEEKGQTDVEAKVTLLSRLAQGKTANEKL